MMGEFLLCLVPVGQVLGLVVLGYVLRVDRKPKGGSNATQ